MIKRIIFSAIILSAVSQFVWSATLGSISSTTIMGSTVVNIPLSAMGDMLDNFDSQSGTNLWGGNYNTIGVATAIASGYDTTVRMGTSGASWRIYYNLPVAGDWTAKQITLGGARDISAYKSLNFDIKGADAGQSFKIEFESASSTKSRVYFAAYADSGTSTGWTHVVIPLDAFANFPSISAMTDIKYINFVFENSYQTAAGLLHSSTVYIDNLAFSAAAQTTLRIEDFGVDSAAGWSVNALGGNNGTMSDSDPSNPGISFSGAVFNHNPKALKMDYSATTGHWCGYWMDIGGGITGSTPTPHNFSSYNSISLAVKGADGLQPPAKIKVELHNPPNIYPFPIAYIPDNTTTPGVAISSSSWNTYTINLSAFSGLDKSAILQCNLVIEDGTVGSNPVGTVYFDDIEFGQ